MLYCRCAVNWLNKELMHMRIAVISKANFTAGGASRFAEDLSGWYAKRGLDVTHFCGGYEGNLQPFQREIHDVGPVTKSLSSNSLDHPSLWFG